MYFKDTKQEQWKIKAMYRLKYPDIAKLMDEVRKHFPEAQLVKVRELKVSDTALYLDCPFSDRDLVKKLGAKWDHSKKKWFVPADVDKTPFKKWGVPVKALGKEIKMHINDLLKKDNKKKRR